MTYVILSIIIVQHNKHIVGKSIQSFITTKIAKIRKSKMADGRHFENRKYAITWPRIVRPDYIYNMHGVARVCQHQLSFWPLFIFSWAACSINVNCESSLK